MDTGMVICLECGANDLHMVQLMPLPPHHYLLQKKHSPTHTHREHQISLSASSIYYDAWHLPYSIHTLYSLFPQSFSKFSLVYLLAWHPPLHTPYISSLNHYLLFAAHAHTIATCFAVVRRLCQLILVSISTLYLGLYLIWTTK